MFKTMSIYGQNVFVCFIVLSKHLQTAMEIQPTTILFSQTFSPSSLTHDYLRWIQIQCWTLSSLPPFLCFNCNHSAIVFFTFLFFLSLKCITINWLTTCEPKLFNLIWLWQKLCIAEVQPCLDFIIALAILKRDSSQRVPVCLHVSTVQHRAE